MADSKNAPDLLARRRTRRGLTHTLVLVLAAAFYLALIPAAVLLSGPVYEAMRCTFGDCDEPGVEVEFVLPTRGALETGSEIRLPNGQPVGTIAGFRATADERYTIAVGRFHPSHAELAGRALRCEGTANFNIQMDADLVVSTCPDLVLPDASSPRPPDQPFVCGAVDHFERMGQQLRRFVLEHVRPGAGLEPIQLSGPCGADNEAAAVRLRQILAGRR